MKQYLNQLVLLALFLLAIGGFILCLEQNKIARSAQDNSTQEKLQVLSERISQLDEQMLVQRQALRLERILEREAPQGWKAHTDDSLRIGFLVPMDFSFATTDSDGHLAVSGVSTGNNYPVTIRIVEQGKPGFTYQNPDTASPSDIRDVDILRNSVTFHTTTTEQEWQSMRNSDREECTNKVVKTINFTSTANISFEIITGTLTHNCAPGGRTTTLKTSDAEVRTAQRILESIRYYGER